MAKKKIKRQTWLLSILVFTLSACGTLGIKRVSMDYANYKELISKEFRDEMWIPIDGNEVNVFAIDEANAPRNSLTAYCERDGGKFVQVSPDSDVSPFIIYLRERTGLFACKAASDEYLWMVEIDARPFSTYRSITSRGYMVKVIDYPIERYKAIVRAHEEQLEHERQAIARNINRFKLMASLKKARGEKVCTWNNKYGYVDEISGDKIKVLVKGVAIGVPYGFFFRDEAGRFNSNLLNEYIWDDAGNWGSCDFTRF